MPRRFWLSLLFVLSIVLEPGLAWAQTETPVAKVAAAMGQNFVLRGGDRLTVSKGLELYRSDQLVTGSNSMVRLVFADGSSVMASQNSSFEIEEYQTRAAGRKVGLDSVLGVVRGKIRVLIKPRDGGHNAVVRTKNAVMGVRGTEFVVTLEEGALGQGAKTHLVVLQGAVALAPRDEEGQARTTSSGQGSEVLVRSGEQSSVVAMDQPLPPRAADAAVLADVQRESEALKSSEALVDDALTKSMVLPAPLTNPGIARTDSRVVVVETQVLEAKDAFGLACNTASIQRLRHAGRTFDEETVPLAKQLAECDELQDEVYFWLYVHHLARGQTLRAQNVTRDHVEAKGQLDQTTAREQDLKLFRNKRVDELTRSLGKGRVRDRQRVLLTARALVLKGNYDDALVLYTEVLSAKTLSDGQHLRWESAYVRLLKGDHGGAESELQTLEMGSLSSADQRDLAFAWESLRRQRLGRGPEEAFVRAFARVKSHSDDTSNNEFGVAWQGETFRLSSGLGGVQWKARDEGNGAKDFGYARLGAGVRARFSTGAAASVDGDFYGADSPLWGARFAGVYPLFRKAEASVLLVREPEWREFLSRAQEADASVVRLGWGIKTFDVARYSGVYSVYQDGMSAITNELQGRGPVHRTALAARRLDVVATARHHLTNEFSELRYAPKSSWSVLGGAAWRWSWRRTLEWELGAQFGYLAREAHPQARAALGPASRPWIERSLLKSALVTEAQMALTWLLPASLSLGLSTDFIAASALDDADATREADGPANKGSSAARESLSSLGLLTLQWSY